MLKKALIFTIVFLLAGCSTTESKQPTQEADAQSTLSMESVAESLPDNSDVSEPDAGKLTATLKETLPSEYQGKAELYFQTAAASSELVQDDTSIYNGAVCAIDGDVITSWQEGAEGNGIGETLTIGFLNPQRVFYLEFNTGNWRDQIRWERNLKPKRIEITVNGETVDVELKNVRASQYVIFGEPVETVAFSIKITDIYPGAEGESDVCISEIRAFGEAIATNERTISDTQPTPTMPAEETTEAPAEEAAPSVNTGVGGLTYNEYGNPNWFESRPYWEREDGQYSCTVSGTTGNDLTMTFSDGVTLSGTYCNYDIQADGTILYQYKKGWYFIYYPSEDAFCVFCDAFTNSTNMGYYYPASDSRISAGSSGSSEGHYALTEENWRNAQYAVRAIIDHLDGYGTQCFISESGKSAITFDDGGDGDSTLMFYTNISGVTPDDVWDTRGGSLSDDSATLYIQNAQGQRAKVVADFSSGTIDFSGIVYRNTATRYYN